MRSTFIAGCVALAATLQVAEARITKISVTRVESPTFEGRVFGSVGPYEKLVGHVEGELDPADQHNSVITDLARAPRNANGKVVYATDIMIIRPIDRSKGNHKVWYELTNRGNVLAFSQFNDAASTITATRRRTRSAARVGSRSTWFSAYRYSTVTFWSLT
jgi:hypothetical protein